VSSTLGRGASAPGDVPPDVRPGRPPARRSPGEGDPRWGVARGVCLVGGLPGTLGGKSPGAYVWWGGCARGVRLAGGRPVRTSAGGSPGAYVWRGIARGVRPVSPPDVRTGRPLTRRALRRTQSGVFVPFDHRTNLRRVKCIVSLESLHSPPQELSQLCLA